MSHPSKKIQTGWRTPPPGTEIVPIGKVQNGDWFYIATLGAWGLCPACAWGQDILKSGHLVARGKMNSELRSEQHWKN